LGGEEFLTQFGDARVLRAHEPLFSGEAGSPPAARTSRTASSANARLASCTPHGRSSSPTRTCPPRATAGASSGRMSRPRASNHPRHRATSAQPQSLKHDPAYVFSAPGRGIAILILPGGPLRFQIGEVTGVSTCESASALTVSVINGFVARISAYARSRAIRVVALDRAAPLGRLARPARLCAAGRRRCSLQAPDRAK
jgi:hypothetical protein